MMSALESAAAPVLWSELQQLASKPENLTLRVTLCRIGDDPPIATILELYAEVTYGVRRLKQRGPLIFNGGRKPGNDQHK